MLFTALIVSLGYLWGNSTIKLMKLLNLDSFYKEGILKVTHNTSLLSKAKGKKKFEKLRRNLKIVLWRHKMPRGHFLVCLN